MRHNLNSSSCYCDTQIGEVPPFHILNVPLWAKRIWADAHIFVVHYQLKFPQVNNKLMCMGQLNENCQRDTRPENTFQFLVQPTPDSEYDHFKLEDKKPASRELYHFYLRGIEKRKEKQHFGSNGPQQAYRKSPKTKSWDKRLEKPQLLTL